MIFFVWSLVLSAVQFARRQRLISVLSEYFIWNLSHNSVLLCRKIPCFSCFSRNKEDYERLTDTLNTLRKASSEPCLPGELIARPIYRMEEMEFVVMPDATQLDIMEWNTFAPATHGSIPRVHFIAFLDKKSDENNETLDDIIILDNSSKNCDVNFFSNISPVMVSNLCNKIAHRRGRPWEILYECTLLDFYDIAFAWLQKALFDIDGKAVVKMMKVITLPEKFFVQRDDSKILQRSISPALSCGEWGINSSCGSQSPEPLSLLELLYEKEHGYNSVIDKDNHQTSRTFSALSLFHSNDSTLQFDPRLEIPIPSTFHHMKKPNSSRSRTYSVSLERTQTVLNEATPFYIKYLKEQNKMNNKSRSQQLGQKTRIAHAEEYILHFSMNSISSEKSEMQEMGNRGNTMLSRTSKIFPEKDNSQLLTDHINLIHSVDHNVQVEFAKGNNVDIGKQLITYHISNDKNCPPNEQNLIEEKMGQLQLQSNEDRVTSGLLSGCLNQVQGKPSQIPIRSDQDSTVMKFKDQKTANTAPIDKAQQNRFAKRTVNQKLRTSTLISEGAYKMPSTTDSNNISLTPLTQSPSLLRGSKEQSKLLGEYMFRIFNNSHLRTTANGGRILEKPLMILVFTGNNDDLFKRILKTLSTLIPSDTHTIHHLTYEAFCKHLWIGSSTACLIIVDTSHLDDKCWIRLQEYFNNSGKILFLCQNKLLASLSTCENSKKTAKLLKMAFGERHSKKLGKDFEHFLIKTLKTLHKEKKVNQTFHAKDFFGGYKYSVVLHKTEDSPFLLYMENAAQYASALFSDATSEELLDASSTLIADALSRLSIKITTNVTIPALTQGCFIFEYDRMPWDIEGMVFNEPFGSTPKLLLRQISKHGPLPEASIHLLPVEVRTRVEHLDGFDDEIYFNRLKTSRLGKALLYIPVCETTMDIGKSLAFTMPEEPFVIVAEQQTKGRGKQVHGGIIGRSGNQWISPVGCAMFTCNYMVPIGSHLSNNIGFIQHIFCVAMVSGICSLRKELENFPLKIKWPNDIYYARTCKLGGLIVNATTIDDKIVCTIGAGLNLSNSKPTACINDFLPPEIRVRPEDYIANTLNKFQYYVDLYENEGENAFLKHYYRFWLHSHETLTLSDTNEKVIIQGIDHNGFLVVLNRHSGKIMTLHPDGNVFDMMKGLITAK